MSAEPLAVFPQTWNSRGRRTTTAPRTRRASQSSVAAAVSQATWRNCDNYDGAELRPYTGRPGAMRAFELPSLVNGVRIERTRPALINAIPERRK
jgi:hypothetical protein